MFSDKTSRQSMRLLSASQAASYLGVSRSLIYRLMHAGTLPVVRVSEHWKFDVMDLDAFITREKVVL